MGDDQDFKPEIEISLSQDRKVRANYILHEPILLVKPDTIQASLSDTIQIQNIGNSTMEWVAESHADWIQIQGESRGENDGTVTVTYTPNLSDSSRIGEVIIYAPDAQIFTDTVRIIQTSSGVSIDGESPY